MDIKREAKLAEDGSSSRLPISSADAAAALDRLLADSRFSASDRNRRFLKFVVGELLAGRQERIKSYTIAVDVFGRNEDFDPNTDPIVRIEATRLRASLGNYYDGPGQAEPIQIRLPKGGYVPLFEVLADQTIAASPHVPVSQEVKPAIAIVTAKSHAFSALRHMADNPRSRFIAFAAAAILIVPAVLAGISVSRKSTPGETSAPAILVQNSGNDGQDADVHNIAIGFARSLIIGLSRFDGIRVYDLPQSVTVERAANRIRADTPNVAAIYKLESSVDELNGNLRFWWKLSDFQSGATIWSDVIDHHSSDVTNWPIEDEISSKIAALIGQQGGLIAKDQLANAGASQVLGYGCVLRTRAYFVETTEPLHFRVRECLERTVQISPNYAETWAMLALVYLDEDRNNFNRRSTAEDALKRALAAADRAVELAPNAADAQLAMMNTYYRKGDFDTAFSAGRRAMEINPNNPEVLAAYGTRLFARGDWEKGAALVKQAVDRQLAVQTIDALVLVFDDYRRADYQAALVKLDELRQANYYHIPMFKAAILGQLGDMEGAHKSIQELLVLRPNYAVEFRTDLRSRHVTEPLIDKLADGLKKAGLAVR